MKRAFFTIAILAIIVLSANGQYIKRSIKVDLDVQSGADTVWYSNQIPWDHMGWFNVVLNADSITGGSCYFGVGGANELGQLFIFRPDALGLPLAVSAWPSDTITGRKDLNYSGSHMPYPYLGVWAHKDTCSGFLQVDIWLTKQK